MQDQEDLVTAERDAQCAVIVASCDSYSETWTPFDILLERFWPDCPFPVYLVSNEREFRSRRIQPITVGPDVSWSGNLLAALSCVSAEYVILMVDDLFLTRPVDTSHVEEILEWMKSSQANCVHLYGRPRAATRHNHLVGPLPKGTYYRTSAVSCLWRKSVLEKILDPRENAWDFEVRGSHRCNQFEGFYSALAPCFSFVNGLIKGKWHPSAVKELQRLGVGVDTRTRGLLSWRQRISLQFIELRSGILRMFPLSLRGKLKQFIQGANFRYRPYSS